VVMFRPLLSSVVVMAPLLDVAYGSSRSSFGTGQGQPERQALAMVEQMDREGFGNCTNEAECEAECPKEISISNIARLNREYLRACLM